MKTLTFTIAAMLISVNVAAHNGATGVVKERMDEMSKMKKASRQLTKLVRKNEPDYLLIANLAQQIANSNIASLELFPEGSLSNASEAKPSIWLNWEHFSQLGKESEIAAQDLANLATNTATGSALKQQFKILTKSCKSCHKKYRAKK